MTHSHDTSTPAMSAETVPSEEAAKLVYEAMVWARDQQPGVPVPKWIDGGNSDAQYEARRVIRKIADLSASHLAKEGGGVGVVEEAFLKLCEEIGIPATAAAYLEYRQRFSLPHPSPALAKGGDTVREALVEPLKWARTTDPSEGSVHYGTGVFGHWYAASRVKPKVWSVNHHIDGKNVIVGLFESLQSAYAAAQSDYDCRIRATLSTPTEGPASQTEGMGGDAAPDVRLDSEKAEEWPAAQKALWRVVTGENLNDGHYINAYRLTEKLYAAIAALTPPETAEAVPVAMRNGVSAASNIAFWFFKDLTGGQRKNLFRVFGLPLEEIRSEHDERRCLNSILSDPEAARLREDLERESKESYEIGKRDGYEEAVQHIDQRTGGDGEYCCVVGHDADDRHCPDPQTMIVRIVGRFENLAGQTNSANQERDDAVKALESVTEELGLFRDFVINNATVWTPGSNHHHPIWARVADRLEGYTSPRDGEKWHLVRAAAASDPAPATDDRERLVAIIELFVSRIERNGSWDDGCFYFNGRAASELERPLKMARAALATEASR